MGDRHRLSGDVNIFDKEVEVAKINIPTFYANSRSFEYRRRSR
jgi:hypothetical protein